MKLQRASNLLICAAFFFVFLNSVNANVCTGVVSGTKLPHDTDCNKFILCDSGASMTLACRSSEPHFDKCTGKCINDVSICGRTTCPESTTTATTQSSTQTSTQAPVSSTTTNGPTTTKFIPPTVPIACSPACAATPPSDVTCSCNEQYGCVKGKCACDSSKICPFVKTDCPTKCGCDDNCVETVSGSAKYLCKPTLEQCPFGDKNDCVKNCGCENNCDCTTDSSSGTPVDKCTCFDPCKCIGPPDFCPFAKSQCTTKCGCDERCLCRADTCTCDSANPCP